MEQVADLPELPPEIWTEIFAHLTPGQLLTTRLVCRRWRDIATGRSVLRTKLAVTFPQTIPIDVDYAPYPALLPVGKVNFEHAPIVGVCSWWPAFGPGLVEMWISDCSVKLSALIGFLEHTPNLKKLALARIKFSGELDEQADIDLCNLEILWLEDFVDCLDIFRNCNLKILRFTWESIEVSTQEFVSFVSRYQSTVEELFITATDEVLIELTKLDRLKLTKLTLFSFEFDNHQLIIEFCRKQPQLEHLDVTQILYFDKVDEDQLKEIAQLLPRLKSFSLNLTPDTLQDLTFVSEMPQLKNLLIDGISGNFPVGVVGPPCPNLTTVKLSSMNFQGSCLQNVLSKMPNLRTLSMQHCTVGCWSDLLNALDSLKLLRTLKLWITNANEPTYCHLEKLTCLKHLAIFLCEMPQDLLATLLASCPNLEELRLPTMDHALGEETVRVIGRKLPMLKRLTVGRHLLSEAGERFIRENCGSLQVLDIKK